MNIKYYLLALCAIFIFSSPVLYAATCHVTTPKTTNFSFGTLIAQRDSPVGTKLGEITWYSGDGRAVDCVDLPAALKYKNYLGAATGIPHVYSTNRPGVGIMIIDSGGNYFENYMTNWTIYVATAGPGLDWGRRFTVTVVKTGNIVSGIVSGGLMAKAIADMDSESNPYLTIMLDNFNVQQVACALETPTMVFPIGNIPATQFGSSVGFIPAGAQSTQNLGLNCDMFANINVSLSGTQNPDVGLDSVLALSGQGSAGVASGVGVQLLYNGTPLRINDRLVLKSSSGGRESFPLTARYYQTRTSVTTGSANTSATLNLTYQ